MRGAALHVCNKPSVHETGALIAHLLFTTKGMQHELPQDNRRPLCEQIVRYVCTHPENRLRAEQLLQFVLSTKKCFDRSNPAGHITGSAWLLNPAGDKALLTLHKKLHIWVQPGGHADGDADVLHVACREAEEESGISGITVLNPEIYDIDIHTIPPHAATQTPQHLHYDVRYLLQAPHEHFRVSDESEALGWFSRNDMEALTPPADEATLRLAHLWQNPQ